MEDIYRFDQSWRMSEGLEHLAGIDEAGRGPIAGPVVASAVILPPDARLKGLTDSKQVTEKNREKLFYEIMSVATAVGIGICDVDDIERLNILGATKFAMKRAIESLNPAPAYLLLDAVSLKDVDIAQSAHVKGDARSASIAAASIIAKYTRDRIMLRYHEMYPAYGFDRHKGYGTKAHMEVLRAEGPCPQHRMGFKGVVPEPELPLF